MVKSLHRQKENPLLKTLVLPIFLFFGFTLLYVTHLSRSVYGGDVGDLITASFTHGIPHPPGYPLFTLLGFILLRLNIFHAPPAFQMGLISAVSAGGGVVCLYFITKFLTKSKLIGVIASAILGFSFLYWFYGEVAEVFALNAFFALILFLFALYFRKFKKNIFGFLFFLSLGLSFSHHQTIVLLVPSLLLLTAKPFIFLVKNNKKFLFFCFLFFLIGLSPYLYIPLAAFSHPLINWDTVHDFSSFFHLITRGDYGTFQAGIFNKPTFTQYLVIVKTYFVYLLAQLTIPVALLVLVGFFKLFKIDRVLFLSISLAWILSGPVFVAVAGFPLTGAFIVGAYERFVLLSSVVFFIPFGIGLKIFTVFLGKFLPKRNYSILFQVFFMSIPLTLFFYNGSKTNLASSHIGDTYANDFLENLPKNAILFISGDTQVFNTWYIHYVLHIRPDVTLYNIGASPLQDGYITPRLKDFPKEKKMDALVHLLPEVKKIRPVFSTSQLQIKNEKQITWVPYGLTYKMYGEEDALPTQEEFRATALTLWSSLHVPTKKDRNNKVNHSLTIAEIPSYYADALIAAGTFAYTHYQDVDTALLLFQKAKEVSPDSPRVYSATGIIYLGVAGKCALATENFQTSLSLNPLQEMPYFLLYNTYTNCFKKEDMAKRIATTYSQLFKKDFQNEMKKSLTSQIIFQ